jgi:NAD(P)-dependent dehydrogenase (short-subunit alcohol dehydrogenase family)
MKRRVALITGGTRGIGLGIARCLTDEGYDLALSGLRDENEVSEVLDQLRAQGAEVLYCQADVGSPSARAAMLSTIRQRMGRLDLLVNNAGVAPQQRCDILQAGEDEFERVLRTNLQGPYFLTQQVANWMIDQRAADPAFCGCIINISSISATIASVSRGEYCISKAGVAMATQLWAVRLAAQGITVYEIRPGIIATDMTAAVKQEYDAKIKEGLIPQHRWGQPEDVGRAVAALARGDFNYSTGQVILVDGGLSLARL